jgi:GNAT superfamily N-acetyltransferase/hypoxanthine phosphoribosyltransferase
MHIVRAKPEDADALTQIALCAKRHWGYPDSWMENWRDVLAVDMESIRRDEVYVAIINDEMLGFYTLAAEGEKLYLEHLFVLPKAMGRGIGRRLFGHALNRATEKGFVSLDIESDPHAEGFYLRMGAGRIGMRIREIAGHRRELPLLVCKTDRTEESPRVIQKSDLRSLSYAEFGQLLDTLADRVAEFCVERGIRIDVVVPILRSGAFPGCHLASKLSVTDILPLQYKHTYNCERPIHQNYALPVPIRDLSHCTLLMADTNTVTGEIARRAAADIRQRWPAVTIIFATMMLDVSLASIPGIDFIIWAQRTNERRGLSPNAAAAAEVSNEVYVFPWEDIDQQWAEIQAAQVAITRPAKSINGGQS